MNEDNELVIYPGMAVIDGLIAASPEILIELNARTAARGFTEGDTALRVNYEDFKRLAVAAGFEIKELNA